MVVCQENICRSPMVEALLKAMLLAQAVRGVRVSSAGVSVSCPGSRIDPRAQQVLASYGIDARGHRSRALTCKLAARQDYIFAVDRLTLQQLNQLTDQCPAGNAGQVGLLGAWLGQPALEIADPFYGNLAGFERVFNQAEQACQAIVAGLQTELNSRR